ncbi:natural killer cells antigen CD94-like [Hypanus sabinus]|nr:natural killer cells antigen CD94-like [Hypanus sabinus]XP_059818387.1 natural killer cells antigen CD94-like [Hypanus sabinus]
MGNERTARGDRSDSSIWLICVLTAALIITGICWRIHVSQIRQAQICSDSNNTLLWSTYPEICHFFTSIREQSCLKDWIFNKDRCYYVSTFKASFDKSMQECSGRNSSLFEINSVDEVNAISHLLVDRKRAYWIGKCEDGEAASGVLYLVTNRTTVCTHCRPDGDKYPCKRIRSFVCEKSAPLYPAIPENIQGLCQQPVGAT